MRDALMADSDDDLDLPAVVRRKAPARPQRRAAKQPRKVGMAERLLTQALSHPGRLLAALFLTGCSGAIAWNALLLQNVRHPAPLFTHQDPAPVEAEAEAVAEFSQPMPPARPGQEDGTQAMAAYEPVPAAPAPAASEPGAAVSAPSVPRPPSRSAMTDLIRNGGVPSPAQAPARNQQAAVAAPAPAVAKAPTVRDPIAEMIRLGGPVPTPPANVGKPDAGDLVLSGQRALARLGYSLKVDGLMGPGTRQAIERFEQDRRLPVTGEFGGRTARELSALSGIAVQ